METQRAACPTLTTVSAATTAATGSAIAAITGRIGRGRIRTGGSVPSGSAGAAVTT